MAHDDALPLWEDALGELDDATAARIEADPLAYVFYEEAMWDWSLDGDVRNDLYERFTEYMEDHYGIEWEEVFDWEAWREDYDAAH